MEKKCFKCKKVQPLECFYKHSGMADGRVNKCKECNKKDVSKNYRANIDYYKEYDKARGSLPERKAYKAISLSKWELKNPIKKLASQVVCNSVRDGKIIKPDLCEDCGSTPIRLHGHHCDYAFPLIVNWLCPGCHNKWHKLNGEGLNGS